MFAKLLVVIVALAGVGAVLLSYREQRLDLMHTMASLHGRMNDTRKQMWTLQTRIAQQTDPQTLRKKLDQAGLSMVAVPSDPPAGAPVEPDSQVADAPAGTQSPPAAPLSLAPRRSGRITSGGRAWHVSSSRLSRR